ncbi:MAG: hypothetical protein HQM08_03575 [Candidatus Riflebacteria bacterium]|nr:hypothetical protein [Candidatus Riflebacteria bacterium]
MKFKKFAISLFFTNRVTGFSLVELISAAIIFVLLLLSVFQVYTSGRKSALEIMDNHLVNDDVQRLVDRVTKDVREANFVDPSLPPTIASGSESSLKTEGSDNRLFFTKIKFDFTKDPTTFKEGQNNYTQEKIEYSVERTDINSATGAFTLVREITPWDDSGKPQTSQRQKIALIDGVDELVFYRLKNSASESENQGSRNIYICLTIRRKDPGLGSSQRYSANVVCSVKVRGSEPDGLQ